MTDERPRLQRLSSNPNTIRFRRPLFMVIKLFKFYLAHDSEHVDRRLTTGRRIFPFKSSMWREAPRHRLVEAVVRFGRTISFTSPSGRVHFELSFAEQHFTEGSPNSYHGWIIHPVISVLLWCSFSRLAHERSARRWIDLGPPLQLIFCKETVISTWPSSTLQINSALGSPKVSGCRFYLDRLGAIIILIDREGSHPKKADRMDCVSSWQQQQQLSNKSCFFSYGIIFEHEEMFVRKDWDQLFSSRDLHQEVQKQQ